MGELLAYTQPRLDAVASENPAFDTVVVVVGPATAAWNAGETVLANTEAAQLAGTLLLEDKLASLTRKPDADTNSLLETWDITIRSVVAYQGSTYTVLLPQGRETLTAGNID